jgi:hypothetical protein
LEVAHPVDELCFERFCFDDRPTEPSKREALERRVKALVLADIDMSLAHATASYLLGEHDEAPGHDGGVPVAVRRILETGLFVTYARPFTGARGLETLPRARGLPPEFVKVHKEIVDLRNIVFAHTADTPYRQLRRPEGLDEISAWPEDLAAWVHQAGGLFDQAFYEQWVVASRQMLEAVRALTEAHHAHFRAQIEELGSRNASRRCPDRGKASVLLASAVRAARIASSESSLPRNLRSSQRPRPISSTVSPRPLR